MNLPSYFFADLPDGSTLNPSMVEEACRTLKRNRERYLAGRSTISLVQTLVEVSTEWLKEKNEFRQAALEHGPAATGFSAPTIARGLDQFFRMLTEKNLLQLLTQELGHPQRLDDFVSLSAEGHGGTMAKARGPELLVHWTAGNIPNPTLMSMVLGILAKSAQFIKCSRGASLLPRLFAHSLYESDRKLGACLELAEWSGGQAPFEETLFHQADALTATGSDDAVTALRNRVPLKCRFLGYGHRVSFGYVAHESLSRSGAGTTIGQGAEDVIAWDQQGCLSPHVIYVERGGGMAPEEWAQRLSVELALRESTEPSGKRSEEDAARTVARRHFHEVRIAAGADGRLWTSPNSTAWTVIYEADSQFIVSSLNRFIYVKAVNDLAEAMRAADGMRRHISTVGVAAPEDRRRHLAQQLAEWGVSRVCELGRMQMPPLTWRHDGRPALGDLVTWCDLEN